MTDRYQGRGISGVRVDALRPLALQVGLGCFVYLVDRPTSRCCACCAAAGVVLRLCNGLNGLVEGHQTLCGGHSTAA
jgi:hypothetical protein